MCDLSDAETRGVVFERKVEFGIVEFKAAEAVRIGEFAERAELIVGERGLEFEFGFEERHGESIAEAPLEIGKGKIETGRMSSLGRMRNLRAAPIQNIPEVDSYRGQGYK